MSDDDHIDPFSVTQPSTRDYLEIRCSPLLVGATKSGPHNTDKSTKKKMSLTNQVQLPERQSKINQIVRRMDDGGSEVYCICRSTDSTSFMICCDHCEEWYHGKCIGVDRKMAKTIKSYYCDLCKEKNSELKIRYKTKKTKCESGTESERGVASRENKVGGDVTKRVSSRKCGECAACHRKQDCGRCDYCKDMKKFGGVNRLRQKCRLRQCMNFFDMSRVAAFNSKKEKDEKDDDPDFSESEFLEYLALLPENQNKLAKKRVSTSPSGGAKRKYTKHADKQEKKHKRPYKKRATICITSERPENSAARGRGRPRKDSHMDRNDTLPSMEEEEELKQCYGPGCVNAARPASKYCSDDCGMKLAKNRIYEILPQRIQQWQTSLCQAEENNKRELDRIRRQQLDSRQRLCHLDQRHRELDALIEKAKREIVRRTEGDEETADDDEEGESSIYCVTCGHEVQQRSALRHMERCFSKYESQTSFGSIYKTRIEGNSMFCDYYNAQQKTYCKRLKVLCPEHSKDSKVGPDEICGCPLVKNVFELTGDFCHNLKRKCVKHYCWEKLRRAEIDMDRVRQWMRLDDLFEQERAIRMSMANRAGVLGLMLHQTIDHDPLKKMTAPELVSGS